MQGTPLYKKMLYAAIAAILGLLLLEGLFSLLWFAVDLNAMLGVERIEQRPAADLKPGESLEAYHSQYDEELGWVHIPGRTIENFYGAERHMTINQDGLRGTTDYIGNKPAGAYRAVCLGDSMTMGYGVGDDENYPAWLGRVNPGVQSVNMGMGGYSTCQCGIWYRRLHQQLDADLLIFSFIADDVARIRNQPPRFRIDGERVVVTNVPVPRYFEPDPFEVEAFRFGGFVANHSSIGRTLRRVVPRSQPPQPTGSDDPLELTRAVIRELATLTREAGRDFAVVLLPNSAEVPGHEYFNLENQRTFWVVSEMTQAVTAELGVPFLNLLPTFASSDDLADLYLDEVYAHFSPAGNERIARTLDSWLAQQFEDYPRGTPPPP